MEDEDVMKLPPAERVQFYISHMQKSRELAAQQKLEEKTEKRQQSKLEQLNRKQLEHKFAIDPKSRPKWKCGAQRVSSALNSKTAYALPGREIHPLELQRTMHLLPKSYLYPTVPFKQTLTIGKAFGASDDQFLSESGKRMVEKNKKQHEKKVEQVRQEEMKIKTVEFGPRWSASSVVGGTFLVEKLDQYDFRKKEMKQECLQEKAFLRTSKYGGVFS